MNTNNQLQYKYTVYLLEDTVRYYDDANFIMNERQIVGHDLTLCDNWVEIYNSLKDSTVWIQKTHVAKIVQTPNVDTKIGSKE